jgi:bifunctional non-homologous end joining protein LigD
MLATPKAEPFDDPNWIFEVKWDGYRTLAEVDKSSVRLYSRNNLPLEKRFAPIVTSMQESAKSVFSGVPARRPCPNPPLGHSERQALRD